MELEAEGKSGGHIEVKDAMAAVGLSPMKLRRVLRAEVGRVPEAAERPLHRSPALRKIFKQGAALASVGGERTRRSWRARCRFTKGLFYFRRRPKLGFLRSWRSVMIRTPSSSS